MFIKTRMNVGKEEWIAQFGSKKLKMYLEQGYDYFQLYFEERMKRELKGFQHYPFGYAYETRKPSAKALRIKKKIDDKYEACIVQVRMKCCAPLTGNEWFEDKEAVFIRDFLGYPVCRVV